MILFQVIESDDEEEEVNMTQGHGHSGDGNGPVVAPGASGVHYDMDTDISKLEAPTFTTLDRGPSQTMISLKWDHNLNLIGKKVRLTQI